MRHASMTDRGFKTMEQKWHLSCYSSVLHNHSLLETGTLPSAGSFAECILSGTRQRRLCRVFFFGTRQRCILPSAIFRHSAKCVFAECLFSGTRQRGILPCVFFLPSANHFFKAIFEALNEFK